MKISQKELIMKYVKQYNSILPAKMAGYVWKSEMEMFGSETSKRCRELRSEGKLISHPDADRPKFERFEKNPDWNEQG